MSDSNPDAGTPEEVPAATSVWTEYRARNYPHVFAATIRSNAPICGGVPTNERVAEGFLKAKLVDREEDVQKAAAELMLERQITLDEAVSEIVDQTRLNGFRRILPEHAERDRGTAGQLKIGGYQLKACLKEAVNVAANAGRITTKGWGDPDNANYRKGIKGWFPEHVFVVENWIPLWHLDGTPVLEPTGISQRFVRTNRGVSGIQYEEYVEDAVLRCTVETDYDFTMDQWAAIWLTAEHMGVGATRSMGFGTFVMTGWDPTEL